MDIISKLNIQLSNIENLLNKDLIQGEVTYNYLVYEDNCIFLDKNELQAYLSTIKVVNTAFLKAINEKCINIINIWNNDFKNSLERQFNFNYSDNKKSFSTTLDFHAVHLTSDCEWRSSNTKFGKKEFVKNYNFNTYSVASIAKRCTLILNFITAAYPETDVFMSFNEFIDSFKDEALSIDLAEKKGDLFKKLQAQKNKLIYADLDSERTEVREYAEKGIKYFKNRLLRFWESEKITLTTLSAPERRKKFINNTVFIVDMRGYFECIYLLEQANSETKSMEPLDKIERILKRLVSIAKKETYSIDVYEERILGEAEEFNRIFSQLNNEEQKKVKGYIKEDFYLTIEITVHKPNIANEFRLKRNYDEVKEFFLRTAQINEPQQSNNEENEPTEKMYAKHYALTYILDYYSSDKTLPIGQKKSLEKIGDEKIGNGKGNGFYKAFNRIINNDLNVSKKLIEIAGENWREIILSLSENRDKLDKYLKSKQL